MNIGAPLTPRPLKTGMIASAVLHAAVSAILIFGTTHGLFQHEQDAPEVMMVRLRGGGENVPGWIKPTTAPPDEALVPDNKPQQRKLAPPADVETPKPAAKAEEKPASTAAAEEPPTPLEQTQAVGSVVSETAEQGAAREDAAAEASEEPEGTPAVTEETGEGIGAKPGPEGPGFGAYSDADFPGADTFLSRVEAEVQRRFNYRGRSTGAVAEYHFYINKRGEMEELILMVSSGINSLDLAARSSLMRAKFPPLPAGFAHPKLGITYRFYDAK